jgi:hypothetical protein
MIHSLRQQTLPLLIHKMRAKWIKKFQLNEVLYESKQTFNLTVHYFEIQSFQIKSNLLKLISQSIKAFDFEFLLSKK